MEREDEIVLARAAYDFHLTVLSNPRLNDDAQALNKNVEKVKSEFNALTGYVRPWAAKTDEELQKESLRALMAKYKSIFGDPNDPKLLAEVEKYSQYREQLRQQRATGQMDESTDERVARLLAAQALRKQGRK